jgi:DNA-directed RNA polymerase subunit beta'
LIISPEEAMIRNTSMSKLLFGRVAAQDVHDQYGTVIVKQYSLITKEIAELIEQAGVEMVKIRSALTCKTPSGVCERCYGMDLSTRKIVDIGSPIGIIAAQSL